MIATSNASRSLGAGKLGWYHQPFARRSPLPDCAGSNTTSYRVSLFATPLRQTIAGNTTLAAFFLPTLVWVWLASAVAVIVGTEPPQEPSPWQLRPDLGSTNPT